MNAMTADEAWAKVGDLTLEYFKGVALGADSRLSPIHIVAAVVIALILYLMRRPAGSFFEWAFPKRIYRNPSFWVDVKISILSYVLLAVRVLNFGAITALVAAFVQGAFRGAEFAVDGPANIWISALALLAAADLGIYLIHRFHHENAVFWPLHSLHHSAEELSPITAFRHHPIFIVMNVSIQAGMVGIIQGIVLGVFYQDMPFAQIAGTNALYVVFNLFGSNLRHSHIWLSFGRPIEYFVISPAMHQVHHSTDPRHFNKNYGEVLAIWDWMFGTLYIPKTHEILTFGLADGEGTRVVQPHPTFRAALWVPMRDAWAALRVAVKPNKRD